jgi:hypothetical protein
MLLSLIPAGAPRVLLLLAVTLSASVMQLSAETELVLRDGTILEGVDLALVEGNYVLTLADGAAIILPLELVKSLHLSGAGEGPTGIRTGQPETLVGPTIMPPGRREQLETLGPTSRFKEQIVDNGWEPSSDWEMDPDRQNNFAPATWQKDLIESVWRPKSAWEANADVLAPGRTAWRRSIIDASWTPTEGFRGGAGWP